jgi:hypothetical protein
MNLCEDKVVWVTMDIGENFILMEIFFKIPFGKFLIGWERVNLPTQTHKLRSKR